MADYKPELRKDPFSGRWVIISTARAKRPKPPEPRQEVESEERKAVCPFCYGNEEKTPPEVYSMREDQSKPDTSGWLTRVVPNKFPAFGIFPEINLWRIGMFQMATGYGVHEVVIESPNHDTYIECQPLEQVRRIVDTWWSRHAELEKSPLLRYVLIFKNHGAAAGASLTHPHTQIIVTTIVPDAPKMKLMNAKEHFSAGDGCIWCRALEHLFYYENRIYNTDGTVRTEEKPGSRVIAKNEKFVAFIPYAARMPYEIQILPLTHQHSFVKTSTEDRRKLAEIMKTVLMKVNKLLGNPAYNFYIHSSPNLHVRPRQGDYGTIRQDFHWHIEILVKTTIWAGFEQGSGIYINPVNPADAAQHLAETDISNCV